MSTCSACGTAVTAGSLYCSRCGRQVANDPSSEPTTQLRRPSDETISVSERRLLDTLRAVTLGEYEILGEIGRGGMSVVFLAHDIALDRKVAIKVMTPALTLMDAGIQDRFKREARTAASLSHPHIIPVYAVKESEDIVYFVMKYVPGRSLESVIGEVGPMPVPVVQTILHQVGSALGYAHRKGVVHRDVKPANIMLDDDGWVVVTDFGIAKVAEQRALTMTGGVVGTPAYMSPEQCAGRQITGAADQYSLGVVAYEMITGRQPFDGGTMINLMYDHCHTDPPPILTRRPECPPELGTAVMRMLAKEPAQRWPSIEEAVAAIGVVSDSQSGIVRTHMLTLARSGSANELLEKFRTPGSPVPLSAPLSPPPPASVPRAAAATPSVATGPAARFRWRSLLWALPVVLVGVVGGWLLLNRGSDVPGATSRANAAPPPAAPAPRSVSTLDVRPLSASMMVGETTALSATPRDSTGAVVPSAGLQWVSADAGVAAVTPEGIVSAAAPGTTQVTVRSGGASASVVVTVAAAPSPTAHVTPPAPARLTTLRVAPGTVALSPGTSVQLIPSGIDQNGRLMSDIAISWSSDAPNVASVSSAGVVRALAAGSARIVARSGARSGVAEVTVTPVAVARLEIAPTSTSIVVGGTAQFSATARDAAGAALADRPVGWRSSNVGVASVSSAGLVTGHAAGTATVSASSGEATASATVTVEAPTAPTSVTDPRVEIETVIEDYRSAVESGDLARLKRVYPDMTREQESGWRSLFDLARDLSVAFQILDVQVNGNTAQVSVAATYEYRTDRPERRTSTFTAHFQRGTQGWRLVWID